jgi:hypothetical protein
VPEEIHLYAMRPAASNISGASRQALAGEGPRERDISVAKLCDNKGSWTERIKAKEGQSSSHGQSQLVQGPATSTRRARGDVAGIR